MVGFWLRLRTSLGFAAAVVCLLGHQNLGSAAPPQQEYTIAEAVSGPGGQWDQAIVDQQTRQLLLAQSGITALDLRTDHLRHPLIRGASTHGVVVLPGGLAAVDEAATRQIEIFRAATGKIVARIRTARANPAGGFHALDSLVWDSTSGQLIAVNGDTGRIVFVDYRNHRIAGSLPLGVPAESGVVNGNGYLFINANARSGARIAVIDVRQRRVLREIPLHDCPEATGIAFDRADDLIMDVCTRGTVKFIQARTGGQVASVAVGRGADDVIFDPPRHRAFVPSADGTLSVLAVYGPKNIRVVQVLTTPVGTRLGAVDEETGCLYLPSARFGPPVPPIPYPSVVPGSFKILVVASSSARSARKNRARYSSSLDVATE